MKTEKAIKKFVKKAERSERAELEFMLSPVASLGKEDLTEIKAKDLEFALGALIHLMGNPLDFDAAQIETRAIRTAICLFFLDCEKQGHQLDPEALGVVKETWGQLQHV